MWEKEAGLGRLPATRGDCFPEEGVQEQVLALACWELWVLLHRRGPRGRMCTQGWVSGPQGARGRDPREVGWGPGQGEGRVGGRK